MKQVAAGRRELAQRHGLSSWAELTRRVQALASGEEPPTPFMLAYRAIEDGDLERLRTLLDEHRELVQQRGTNDNDLFGIAGHLDLVRLLLERGADVNRGNDYGWTKLHQAGYGNDRRLAELLLAAGARTDLSARGDGGTPLVVALFWGHREVVDLLGLEPRNLCVAAGLGRVNPIDELAGTPAAGAHRGFYRPHGGFSAWQPTDNPQEILDEALVWAAKADGCAAVTAVKLLPGPARSSASERRTTRPPQRRRPRSKPAQAAPSGTGSTAAATANSARPSTGSRSAGPLPRRRPRPPRTQEGRRQVPTRSHRLPQAPTRPRRLQHPQSQPRLDMEQHWRMRPLTLLLGGTTGVSEGAF